MKEENFELKGEIKIRVQYDAKKDQSTISIREPYTEKVKEIRNGLVLLLLTTENGQLKYSY